MVKSVGPNPNIPSSSVSNPIPSSLTKPDDPTTRISNLKTPGSATVSVTEGKVTHLRSLAHHPAMETVRNKHDNSHSFMSGVINKLTSNWNSLCDWFQHIWYRMTHPKAKVDEALSSKDQVQPMNTIELSNFTPEERQACSEAFIAYFDKKGVKDEGLFRLSGKNSKTDKLCGQITAKNFQALEDSDINDVATAYKRFIRANDLFGSSTSDSIYEDILAVGRGLQYLPTNDAISKLHELMTRANQPILAEMLALLSKVSQSSEVNKMQPPNLAICFAPNLVSRETEPTDFGPITCVLTFMIEHREQIEKGT